MVQVLVDVLDHGWALHDAIGVPRVHDEGNLSEVDERLGPEVIDQLRRLGHQSTVVSSSPTRPAFSRINGIFIAPDGQATSGVEPLGDAGAAAPSI